MAKSTGWWPGNWRSCSPSQISKKKKDPANIWMFIQLDMKEYEVLLAHVQIEGNDIWDYWAMPHPLGSYVMQPYIISWSVCKITDRLLALEIKPNSCIKYLWECKKKIWNDQADIKKFKHKQQMGKSFSGEPNLWLVPKKFGISSRHFCFVLSLLKCMVGQIDKKFVVVSSK